MTTPWRLLVAVGIGAAVGSIARSFTSVGMVHLLGGDFPWGTVSVNVAGSLLIGLAATLMDPDGRVMATPAMRHGVLTGFCGGFTTFSVFSLETCCSPSSAVSRSPHSMSAPRCSFRWSPYGWAPVSARA